MPTTSVTTHIDATVDRVFDTVAHIENFAKAVPDIVETEFLTDVHKGVGTRFRETRTMGKRTQSHDLEVTEFAENERVRIVTDSHGTVWDTVFDVSEKDGGTELVMTMDARPHQLLQRLIVPLMKGFVRKAIVSDMEAVKKYCEQA